MKSSGWGLSLRGGKGWDAVAAWVGGMG